MTNTERLDSLEARLADALATNAALTERVAFLERCSPQWHDAKKHAEQLARVAKAKSAATVDQWRALSATERDLFSRRATRDQLLAMLRDASSEDRRAVLAGARPEVVASVAFELAPAPALVEVTAHGSFSTRPVPLDGESQAEQLAALGLPTTGRLGPHAYNLQPFAMNLGDAQVLDVATWDARRAHDAMAARLVADGRVTVRRLSDEEARAHALHAYNEAVIYARDWADSRLAPQLPEF